MRGKQELNRELTPGVGQVVWCRVAGHPWWPARIVDREEHLKTLVLEDDEYLAPKTDSNVTVVFFDDESLTGVAEKVDVVEYTSNMQLVRQTGRPRNDVIHACRKANQYIESDGTPEQRERYDALEPFDEFIMPASRRLRPKVDEEPVPSRRRKSIRRSLEGGTSAIPDDEPRSVVEDLLKGSEFVNRGLAADDPNVDELQTVNRLITIGLRKLQVAAPRADSDSGAGTADELATAVDDVLKGSELVDGCLRSDTLDLHRVRMLSRLVAISLKTLRDGKFQEP